MTRHLLRLIWNRRRHNLLLSLEVFCSFLVTLAVTTAALTVLNNWRQPLGYTIENVWRVHIARPEVEGVARTEVNGAIGAIVAELRGLPEVEAVAGVVLPPYASSDWARVHDARGLYMGANAATDGLHELMGLNVVAGRWFSADDDAAQAYRPVVINTRLARAAFGSEDPIGQTLPTERWPAPDGWIPPPERVVGVIEDYRKGGELGIAQPYVFNRIALQRAGLEREFFPEHLVVRVRAGTTAEFEERMLRAVQPLARDWTFEIRPLAADRQDSFATYRAVLGVVGTVAVSLLLMVGLGLTGVIWQNVTERTREFGLRRAKGAAARDIRRQVVVETVLIASLGIVPAVLLTAQIPALPMPRRWAIGDGVFLLAVAVSAAAIYLVVLACAWYPSRLATRIQPAEALHYE